MWLRKKTPNLPTICRSCRWNPHDQSGRLCVCGIYERPLRAPAEENTLVLIAVGAGGKNTQEQDQVRTWAAPTAGPETSSAGGHPREVRWTVTPSEGKDSESSDSRKNIYYSYVLTCSVDSFGFPHTPPPAHPCRSYWFYWHYET